MKLKVKTRGNSSPQGKRRVYFTCHPADFDKSFEKTCEDIFQTQDCAIYYAEDMNEEGDEDYLEQELRQMNLIVIPVSFRLMTEENRVMRTDFPYALKEHIPVLPVMTESGLKSVYGLPKNFGDLQFLDPNEQDATSLGYEDKLMRYLESVLIGEEMAERIRNAFDAYIFLSYRKKDRKHANELMRLIHRNPEYRDVAIWYDEYLTPGENFNEAIDAALKKSSLFTLLVTPNLVNEENYIRTTEYPAARAQDKDILPVEMEETDREQLKEQFEGVPDCVSGREEKLLRQGLLQAIEKIAVSENNDDPAHNFLIGLAYLDGIDVEVDRERGLELITDAAERELPEAMEKLADMYHDGYAVERDYQTWLAWRRKILAYWEREDEKAGEELSGQTIQAQWKLAHALHENGQFQEALRWYESLYKKDRGTLGEDHPEALSSLNNLAVIYGKIGEHHRAKELLEQVYEARKRILGEEHPNTLTSLYELAYTYGVFGEHHREKELNEQVYEARKRILGEEHPDTLNALHNLAFTYGKLGDYHRAKELLEHVYEASKRIRGEDHPYTLSSLHELAYTHGVFGEHHREKELGEHVYEARKRVLGENHPDTLLSLNNLAVTYGRLGEHHRAKELLEHVYEARKRILGEDHPATLNALHNLASTHRDLGEHHRAKELNEQVYEARKRILGEEHPDTLRSLDDLA